MVSCEVFNTERGSWVDEHSNRCVYIYMIYVIMCVCE